MGVITSKWPGKCRRCGVKHKAMDPVYWDKGSKGVLCLTCANNEPEHLEEDDDLKVPKVATLKRGHKLYWDAGSSVWYNLFGCESHSVVCECVGCSLQKYYSSMTAYVAGPLHSGGKYIPPGMTKVPDNDASAFSQSCGEYYVIVFVHHTDDTKTFSAQIPRFCISEYHAIGMPWSLLHVAPGAPTPDVLANVTGGVGKPITYTNGCVEYLNERQGERPEGLPQPVPVLPSEPMAEAVTTKNTEAPTTVTANLSDAAVSLVAALQASAVPEAKVREIALETITQELKKLPAKNHKIKFNDAPPMEFEGTMHGMATEIMEAILCGFHNIMVVGPAGSGKTFLFSQIAQLIKKEMKWDEADYAASMSCAPGQTESMFVGRMIPSITTGNETYHGTNLTRLYAKENGGAFLFDEISNSEPTVMNLVNAMIALDGHVTLPDGRVLSRPRNMVVFAADNTWGQGGDRMYIRNQLDAATLDRFTGAKFFMDYDEKLEQALCPMKEVYESVAQLRQKVTSLKLRRIVSTRAFAAAHRMGSNGMKQKDILKRLTIDWSENDRKSVGVA